MSNRSASRPLRRNALCSALLAVLVAGMPPLNAHAQDAQPAAAQQARSDEGAPRSFDIPAQPAASGLNAFAEQADITLVFSSEGVSGANVNAIHGSYTIEDAIARMLEGTALSYRRIGADTVAISGTAQAVASARATGTGAPAARAATDAEADGQSIASEQETVSGTAGAGGASGQVKQLDTITVTATGTNIRNIQQKFSPVISMTREELDLAGFASPADYLQQLPQNFGGGGSTTPDRGFAGASGPGFSSVNLRGLGNEATLVLLNGRRIAASGTEGDAIDTSMIPSGALQRVDVLTDGASAIYGADAVAGVVNFMLRRDYIGNETRVRLGSKSGDATDYKFSHTWGAAGERGRALISYEYAAEQALEKDDREYSAHLDIGNDILPATRKHGILVATGLDLPSGGELFADMFYAKRDSRQETFLNSSHRISKASSTSLNGTIGTNMPLGGDWVAELSASTSVTDFVNDQRLVVVQPGFGRLGMWNDEFAWNVDAKLDGSLVDLWGGTMRGVFGVQYRRESHDGAQEFYDAEDRPLNLRQMEADVDRSVKSAYAELYAPLSDGFDLSLAARYDDYSDFGSTFNPKLGLAWTLLEGVTLRGSYGTSFRAPRLGMMVDKIGYVEIYDYVDRSGQRDAEVAAYVYGDSSDLEAEESTSKSFGIALSPPWAPELDANINYYSIDYTGRIATPAPRIDYATYRVYGWPLPLERDFTLEQINAWISRATFGVTNYTALPGGSNSDLEDVTILLDGRPTNTAVSRQRGVDADIAYRWLLPESALTIRVNGNYILEAEDRFSSLLDPVPQYGIIFRQARFKGRAGLNWASEALSINLAANYVGSNRDDRFPSQDVRVSSWLTYDASLQFRFGDGRSFSWLAGTRLTLSVQNLFDKNPPRIAPSMVVGGGAEFSFMSYDSANADPYGRWMSVQLTKEW